ncbi:hypothetical protein FJ987_06315 [Mesorhizobium sp. CU2]|uniref:hypothetical protein n=1 Tax=unclassified Mesorhizobium TaxID=325217 RepID=UPI0011276EAE|nr:MULTISPECIES: hypothetical protein [unclassified Mesorhizobium]TPN86480.1 hypothetical protein FJ988_06760 [Mesorhizobium sp. CU3]TPO19889.1 hypothetical protein FJ987_06315 [Mesorhizobium sp. CU2]
MARQKQAFALAIFLGSTVWTYAADFGDADCAAGQKMKPKTVMCIPRVPRNWIVCTGVANTGSEGLWKDTGVPCELPPPKVSADYRPVAPIPHPPPLAPGAKRVIDQFRGIFFHCSSMPSVDWTGDACTEITDEFVRQAKAAGLRYALVGATEPDAAKAAKGHAAGIPLGSEMQWSLSFKTTDGGELSLHPALSGVVEMLPGIWSPQFVIIGGDIHFESEATGDDAEKAAKDLLKTDFDYLLAVH